MMPGFVTEQTLPEFSLWRIGKRVPFSFDLEITARCNNDCRQCYINLPAGDRTAQARELSVAEIDAIAGQAVELGALWCLITGGEPLLRPDFHEIYRLLKKKGLLISLFTNACLVTDEHVRLLQAYPPRDVEVTVYGVTAQTYERVTRKPGSYAAFRRGLERLMAGGIKVRLKAMALRSNLDELPAIAEFCREHTKDTYRFDALLHQRLDRDLRRNAEILAERLTAAQIVEVEQADPERSLQLQEHCRELVVTSEDLGASDLIFKCGAGNHSFSVSWDGYFRLCASLVEPGSIYDLRQGELREAWHSFVPEVRARRSTRPEFLSGCGSCELVNLCQWCPAVAELEVGELDGRAEAFCEAARARAAAFIPGPACA
jgi:radical SAM protein with 4Fe4S-binding SPASM domain